jgi:hypothetical protein
MTRTVGSRRRVLLSLVVAVIAAAGTTAGVLIATAGSACQKTAIPAYFYPGPVWTRAIDSTPAPGIMIIDISGTGAGDSPVPEYRAVVSRAQAAGTTVLGYADTDYTQRSISAVETDVARYKSWYHVTGIFLDRVSSDAAGLPYYRTLAGFVHSTIPGSIVMLNPGTYPDQSYLSVGDILLVYEGSYADYAGLQVPGWVRDYPASRFAQVVYSTPAADLDGALRLSQGRNAGYIYVTDNSGPDPYGSLPSYWSAEETVIGRCSVA